jgi:diacylglycerol kinase (ATP)
MDIKPDNKTENSHHAPQVERVFVVLNPVAGLTDAVSARERIEEFCSTMGWDCKIHETAPEDDLKGLVQGALNEGVDLIIAAGGDGTVSGVVSGMVNSEVPMVILPAGTGNALARDLGIPLDIEQALAVLGDKYAVRTLDVMEINEKDFFVLNVSVGLSSLTMRTTAREEKRRFGMLAYLWRAVGRIAHSELHRFRVIADGEQFKVAATEVMIANSKLMGLQPQFNGVVVDANDGKLDLFILRAASAGDYISVASGFLFRTEIHKNRNVRYLQVRDRIEIRSEFPLPVQADGEEIGNTPVRVRLVPNALRVVVPPAKD